MIDFHTHILPGIDDGSKDMDMTIRMLEEERNQGVSHIYATPHFYAHRRSVDFFLERRNKALAKVSKVLAQRPDLPKTTAGAEVYYFRGIERAELLPQLCIEGTNLLLLEMPFDQWTGDMARAVQEIIRKRGLKVVMAHIERYWRMQKDQDAWDRILDLPVILQMNAESFIDEGSWIRPNRTHKLCMKLLEEYEDCIIGTDCHNLTDRPPNLQKARAVVAKKAGTERLERIDQYMETM